MADKSSIEWTEATWNPIRGCSRISEGCRNCYAERVAARFSGLGQAYEGLAEMTNSGPRWSGELRLVEEHLEDPLRWKRPRRIFVNSMSDLFHEGLSDEAIDKVFAVMALCPQHTFQVLTKRAERMQQYFASFWGGANAEQRALDACLWADKLTDFTLDVGRALERIPSGLPNVHLGVSVEDQKTADERIPFLLKTPAGLRWISYEPALGPIKLGDYLSLNHKVFNRAGYTDALSWVVVGGESGPGARPFDLQWARDVVDHCQRTKTPVFVKQLGAKPMDRGTNLKPIAVARSMANAKWIIRDKKGGDINEWPEDLRVRQYPCR